jgi:hypothetical protein
VIAYAQFIACLFADGREAFEGMLGCLLASVSFIVSLFGCSFVLFVCSSVCLRVGRLFVCVSGSSVRLSIY